MRWCRAGAHEGEGSLQKSRVYNLGLKDDTDRKGDLKRLGIVFLIFILKESKKKKQNKKKAIPTGNF